MTVIIFNSFSVNRQLIKLSV